MIPDFICNLSAIESTSVAQFCLVESWTFQNLKKYSEYDIFIRAWALQSISNAIDPNEFNVGSFRSNISFRTKEDGISCFSDIATHI